jgi:hypothetical protein
MMKMRRRRKVIGIWMRKITSQCPKIPLMTRVLAGAIN